MKPDIELIEPNRVVLTRYKKVKLASGKREWALDEDHPETYGQEAIDDGLKYVKREKLRLKNYDPADELAKLDEREAELQDIQWVMNQ